MAGNDPKPQGYSIDLCLRIVDGIKKELALPQLDVKWVKVTPETRIASVANGTVDIECGSTTKTLSRMAQVDFTVLTFLDGGSLLTVSSANINKLTDLAGKRVAVIPGTTTEAAVRDMVRSSGSRT
jgi:glutamate/aspartate transport system substrate-binding protein